MPIMYNRQMVSFHEPLASMSNADLREYMNALIPFMKTNPITVQRKIDDIKAEIEWRRIDAQNSKAQG